MNEHIIMTIMHVSVIMQVFLIIIHKYTNYGNGSSDNNGNMIILTDMINMAAM